MNSQRNSLNPENNSNQQSITKTFPFLNDEPSESLYDTLGWNESSFNEEDTLYVQINNIINAKAKTVSYARVEEAVMPKFLLTQVTGCEKFSSKCCCCCCFRKRVGYRIEDIEETDLLVYGSFKLKAAQVYNQDDSSHENSLRFLYIQTLSCDITPKLINERWKEIGFTSEDPRIDIKAGGYYSLLFINHFIMAYNDEYALIRSEGQNFYFAMCAIIICLYVRLALDAFNSDKIADSLRKENNIQPVNVYQFTNFCRQFNNNSNYPFEIMSNILLQAKEQIIKDNSSNLNSQIIVVRNHFNNFFYQELDSYFDYGNSEASLQSSNF